MLLKKEISVLFSGLTLLWFFAQSLFAAETKDPLSLIQTKNLSEAQSLFRSLSGPEKESVFRVLRRYQKPLKKFGPIEISDRNELNQSNLSLDLKWTEENEAETFEAFLDLTTGLSEVFQKSLQIQIEPELESNFRGNLLLAEVLRDQKKNLVKKIKKLVIGQENKIHLKKNTYEITLHYPQSLKDQKTLQSFLKNAIQIAQIIEKGESLEEKRAFLSEMSELLSEFDSLKISQVKALVVGESFSTLCLAEEDSLSEKLFFAKKARRLMKAFDGKINLRSFYVEFNDYADQFLDEVIKKAPQIKAETLSFSNHNAHYESLNELNLDLHLDSEEEFEEAKAFLQSHLELDSSE